MYVCIYMCVCVYIYNKMYIFKLWFIYNNIYIYIYIYFFKLCLSIKLLTFLSMCRAQEQSPETVKGLGRVERNIVKERGPPLYFSPVGISLV